MRPVLMISLSIIISMLLTLIGMPVVCLLVETGSCI